MQHVFSNSHLTSTGQKLNISNVGLNSSSMDWPERLWSFLVEHLRKLTGRAPGCSLSMGRTGWTQSFCPPQEFWDSVFLWLQSRDCKGKVTSKNFVIQLKPILHMELNAGRNEKIIFIFKIRLRIKIPKKSAMRKSWDSFQWNRNTTSGAWTLILGNALGWDPSFTLVLSEGSHLRLPGVVWNIVGWDEIVLVPWQVQRGRKGQELQHYTITLFIYPQCPNHIIF